MKTSAEMAEEQYNRLRMGLDSTVSTEDTVKRNEESNTLSKSSDFETATQEHTKASKSAEQAKEEYNRIRMSGMKISDDDAKATSSSDAAKEDPEFDPATSTEDTSKLKEEPKLDATISKEDAAMLKEEGNKLYKSGDYETAIEKYSRATKSAHASDDDRAVFLGNRAAAYLKLQRFNEVVDDCTEALRLRPAYVKVLSRRKEAREALKDWRGALEDARELKQKPSELQRLQFLADEKEKKDRAEALDSLKGLGNSILSNFGMSIDDFAMEKDPNTGSYNISMKR